MCCTVPCLSLLIKSRSDNYNGTSAWTVAVAAVGGTLGTLVVGFVTQMVVQFFLETSFEKAAKDIFQSVIDILGSFGLLFLHGFLHQLTRRTMFLFHHLCVLVFNPTCRRASCRELAQGYLYISDQICN